jgi:hypothetical protein
MKIQRINELESEMRKVARGEMASPDDAAESSREPYSITLSPEDQRVVAEAILNPPEPTAVLRRAAEAHQRLIKETR